MQLTVLGQLCLKCVGKLPLHACMYIHAYKLVLVLGRERTNLTSDEYSVPTNLVKINASIPLTASTQFHR